MRKSLKSILFVICIFMAFTAQTNRPDDKGSGQQRAPVSRSTAPSQNNQSRGTVQTQTRRVAPVEATRREEPTVPVRIAQPQVSRPEREMPVVHAVAAPVYQQNNRFLNRQHQNNWQPLYNYYDNQYHFYPYVNVASVVDLSANCVTVDFNGQTYYYDRGRFYLPDGQGGYVAAAPPIGIIVNAIPDHARQVIVDGQVYYRYKGIFYVQLAQGYQVVGPVQ